jgi:predicted GIY-YIG superfamily endonuclease
MEKVIIPLQKVLACDGHYFSGECHVVEVGAKELSFIKGPLERAPVYYKHRLYKTVAEQSAAYILQSQHSGHFYIGSSAKIGTRTSNHRLMIRLGRHSNPKLAELLENQSLHDFDLVVIFTESREEAYAVEQVLIDLCKGSSLLLNVAYDVKAPLKGVTVSELTRQRMSQAALNRAPRVTKPTEPKLPALPLGSKEASQRMAEARRTNPVLLAQTAQMQANKRRRVHVDGTDYESISEARILTGLSDAYIREYANKNSSKIYFLDEAKSPLKGRSLSEEHRASMAQARKTSPAALSQFAAIQQARTRKVVLNGVAYTSVLAAVRATGIPEHAIHTRLKRNRRDGATPSSTITFP